MRLRRRRMPPAARFFIARIFPWIFALVGTIVVLIGLQEIRKARQSVSWPTVGGVILSSQVENQSSDGSTTYHAKIRYQYDVVGELHQGTRVAYGDLGTNDPSRAEGIVARYPEGRPVTVSYRPEDPEESVLEPGLKPQAYFLLALGIPFMLIGLLMSVLLPKMMAKIHQRQKSEEGSDPEPPHRPPGVKTL